MRTQCPHMVILAGPNGAGKSTAAPELLRGALRVDEFVNADTIARGLSAFAPDRVAVDAGRILLRRLSELARARRSFAFETTLASRSFARRIEEVRELGYRTELVFLSLPDANVAVKRVASRVRHGGHDVPVDTVVRRFGRGLANLFDLYMPIVDRWRVYDNSRPSRPALIAIGDGSSALRVFDERSWNDLRATARTANDDH